MSNCNFTVRDNKLVVITHNPLLIARSIFPIAYSLLNIVYCLLPVQPINSPSSPPAYPSVVSNAQPARGLRYP